MIAGRHHAFVQMAASLIKDGENDDGETFVMENDDAYDALHALISEARDILGLPQFNEPPEEEA